MATAMERPVQAINEIVKGKKAITAETAVQLEDALGIPAHLWLNMQSTFDLRRARQIRQGHSAASRPAGPGRAARGTTVKRVVRKSARRRGS